MESLLPKEAAATVSKLLALSDQEFGQRPGQSAAEFLAQLAKAHAEFLELLKALDQQVDDDSARKVAGSARPGIELNLIGMARDYSKRPDRLAQLVKLHGSRPPGAKRIHTFLGGHPAPEHAVEGYRPAWELLLLAPSTDASRTMRRTCFEAIGLIKNDASIPLLLYLYERANTQARPQNNNALDEQVRVLETLNAYCSAASLRAMLLCVGTSEAVPPPLPKVSGWTMKERALRYLRDEANYRNGEQWRKVMAQVLREKLPDADRSFLEEALKEIPKE